MSEYINEKGPISRKWDEFSGSAFGKALFLLILGIALLVPLGQIEGLLLERQFRKAEAVSEISQKWGGQQRLIGPVLEIPILGDRVTTEIKRINGVDTTTRRRSINAGSLFYFPDTIDGRVNLEPEMRYRGIFRTPVYEGALNVRASWQREQIESNAVKSGLRLDWGNARVLTQVTSMQNVTKAIGLKGEEALEVESVLDGPFTGEWIAFPFDISEAVDPLAIDVSLGFRGSGCFRFLPSGKEGVWEVSSTWKDPSFLGALFPSSREVSDDGFVGTWTFGKFGRGFDSHWRGTASNELSSKIGASYCGVELLDTVDVYRLTERCMKYGLLFVGLGFAVFFFFDVVYGLKLHPMQYLLAGFAQVTFFLLLLALSEVMSFVWAYSIGAGAAIGLVAFYSLSLLKRKGRAWITGGVLAGVYAMLLVTLKQQDLALLAGASLVFFTLASFMFVTRNIDWRDLSRGRDSVRNLRERSVH